MAIEHKHIDKLINYKVGTLYTRTRVHDVNITQKHTCTLLTAVDFATVFHKNKVNVGIVVCVSEPISRSLQ